MDSNNELRTLTDEEVDAVAGAAPTSTYAAREPCYIDNVWDDWIYNYFGICV